jgi:hypothetical protein
VIELYDPHVARPFIQTFPTCDAPPPPPHPPPPVVVSGSRQTHTSDPVNTTPVLVRSRTAHDILTVELLDGEAAQTRVVPLPHVPTSASLHLILYSRLVADPVYPRVEQVYDTCVDGATAPVILAVSPRHCAT